jgi:hypothetical protein
MQLTSDGKGESEMSNKIEFVRTSNNGVENLNSMTLEVYVDGAGLAEIYCADYQWKIRLFSAEGPVDMLWFDFLQIVYEYSKLVTGESETIFRELQRGPDELDS